MSDQESYTHTGSNDPAWALPARLEPQDVDAIAERLAEKLKEEVHRELMKAASYDELGRWLTDNFPVRYRGSPLLGAIELLEEYRKLL